MKKYLAILAQLALLLVVFRMYRVEEPAFFALAAVAFAGFSVSYWLPRDWKEPFFVALSVGGAFIITDAIVVVTIVVVFAAIYGIARTALPFQVRAGLILALLVALMLGREIGPESLPVSFWPTIGAVFMFRTLILVYDLRSMKDPPPFTRAAAYFLMLPSYYFLFFPVIDYQTMTKTFGRRDFSEVAQSGVTWIVRGTIQLLLYRVVVSMKPESLPQVVTTFPTLVENMGLTYLLYLRVSGTFHVSVGMLHLFGYDLPETHRRYLLASSLTDFWRRINIYWKDFMVKIVYFPVFFRLRRQGGVRAQVIATTAVFLATWALHAYQYYWLTGRVLLTLTDLSFWAILGGLVILNLIVELKAREKGPKAPTGRVVVALKTSGTLALIIVLWSMWSSPTFSAWFDLLTFWTIG